MDLDGVAALVTGGAGGLGAATARHLATCGTAVVVIDRNGPGAEAVAGDIKDGGGRAIGLGGDVSDDGDVAAAVDAARALGPLSLVVNVAGGGTKGARTVARDGTPHPADIFRYTMEINAFGTFNVARLAAAAMATNDPDGDGQRGVIVNTSSLAGLEGQTGQLAYAAAKAAIAGMTLPMARDLAVLGIRVCTIAPGTMATPLFVSAPESLKAQLLANVAFPKRMGRPEEFASLVEMIARNDYLNGEVFRLDAGMRFPPK